MSLVDNMLTCRLGETDSKLKVTFKKTVKVREYETEVIEATNEVTVGSELSGMERVFISEILKCQMEYMVYIDLLKRGTVTEHEYTEKRLMIEDTLQTMVQRAASVGIDVSKYIGMS